MFALALDIECQWMLGRLMVQQGMISLTDTTTVEAVETHVETFGVVNTVKTLCAILSIDRLERAGRLESWRRQSVGGVW